MFCFADVYRDGPFSKEQEIGSNKTDQRSPSEDFNAYCYYGFPECRYITQTSDPAPFPSPAEHD